MQPVYDALNILVPRKRNVPKQVSRAPPAAEVKQAALAANPYAIADHSPYAALDPEEIYEKVDEKAKKKRKEENLTFIF